MNSITVSDFCKTALKRILVNSDQTNQLGDGTQLNDAINELNLIIDSWNTDGKMIYTQQFQTFTLNVNQQVYTIGPGGDFDTGTQPRPPYLEYAAFQITSMSPVVDVPLKILDADEWASIRVKGVSASISNYIYMDEGWPLANVYLWGVPSTTANLVLTSWQYLNSALVANSVISLPPGYARGLNLDLAISLAPNYGKAGEPVVAQLSSQLSLIKKQIGWMNLRGGDMVYSAESQGTGGGGGVYVIATDSTV